MEWTIITLHMFAHYKERRSLNSADFPRKNKLSIFSLSLVLPLSFSWMLFLWNILCWIQYPYYLER